MLMSRVEFKENWLTLFLVFHGCTAFSLNTNIHDIVIWYVCSQYVAILWIMPHVCMEMHPITFDFVSPVSLL